MRHILRIGPRQGRIWGLTVFLLAYGGCAIAHSSPQKSSPKQPQRYILGQAIKTVYGQRVRSPLITGDARVVVAPAPSISSLVFSPNGKYLLVGRAPRFPRRGATEIWDLRTRKLYASFGVAKRVPALTDGVVSLVISPDSKTVAVQDFGRKLTVWDIQSRSMKAEIALETTSLAHPAHRNSDQVNSMVFLPTGELLYTTNGHAKVFLLDVKTGKTVLVRNFLTQNTGNMTIPIPTILRLSPDGRTSCENRWTRGKPAVIAVHDLRTGKRRYTIEQVAQGGTVPRPLFSPDGKYLAILRERGTRLYLASTGVYLRTLPGNIELGALSADSKWIAGINSDLKIHVAHVPTGRVARSFVVNDADRGPLALSPDGKILAVGCEDSKVILWNIRH